MKGNKLRLSNMAAPSLGPFTAPMPQFDNQAFNPFFSNIRQNMELSHGPIRERFPIRLPPHCTIQGTNIHYVDTMAPRCIAGGQVLQGHIFTPPSWLQATLGDQGTQFLAETYEVSLHLHYYFIVYIFIILLEN
jgi:protein-tyrosine phosphatase